MTETQRRNLLIGGAIALALLSIAGGAMIALSDDDRRTGASSPTTTPSAQPTATPSPTQSPSASPTPEPTASPSLADGRHLVYVTEAARLEDGSSTITFDLAYFYTGDRAEEEATERGDEVVNDYYIVNENPRLRTLSLADVVTVRYIPVDACCELQDGDVDPWLESILETNPTDYAGRDVPWWFRVEGGLITRIEQQYLP